MSRCRIIVWGPGEIGGSVVRAAAESDEFEVVGALVYSAHKHGRDIGTLAGIDPLGVRATTSRAEIIATDADVVVLTPQPMAIVEGIDRDVIALLESGKSVVTTLGYHNPAMPNWHNQAQTPTDMFRELSNTAGLARSPAQRCALAGLRRLTANPAMDRLTDPLLRAAVNRIAPPRAPARRLAEACRTGGSVLHGTGVHPTFQVENLLLRMTSAMTDVTHIRFIEAFDFSNIPEGMWGGLEVFGYGRNPSDIDNDWLIGRFGDFYYGDLIGNVGHALYGARPDEIRVERTVRTRPAVADMSVGSVSIAEGTVAAIHMSHDGYIGDHHFFTNEEIWYLGAENAFRGYNVPFGKWPNTLGGYTYEITGKPYALRGQISTEAPPREKLTAPITWISVRALLDAALATRTMQPGAIIDDPTPRYRTAGRAADEGAVQHTTRCPSVIVWGSGTLADRIRDRIRERSAHTPVEVVSDGIADVLDRDPGSVVVVAPMASSPPEDPTERVEALLTAGRHVIDVVGARLSENDLHELAAGGDATYYCATPGTAFWVERILAHQLRAARTVSDVHHVQLDDTVDDGGMDVQYEDAVRRVCSDLVGGNRGVSVRTTRDKGAVTYTAHAEDGPKIVVKRCSTAGADDAPFGGFTSRRGYSTWINGEPADSVNQWQYDGPGDDLDTTVTANLVVEVLATLATTAPGIVVEKPGPKYAMDTRL